MSGSIEQAALTRTVELKGHVIDSLTLSKVIDLVQQLGGDYRLNDIRVGSLKKDVSSLNLTLMAPDTTTMKQLLEAVVPYGAVAEASDAEIVVCQKAGVLPEEAYLVKLPRKVRQKGQWVSVEDGGAWTLRLQDGQAQLVAVGQLQVGDQVVRGTHGLDW